MDALKEASTSVFGFIGGSFNVCARARAWPFIIWAQCVTLPNAAAFGILEQAFLIITSFCWIKCMVYLERTQCVSEAILDYKLQKCPSSVRISFIKYSSATWFSAYRIWYIIRTAVCRLWQWVKGVTETLFCFRLLVAWEEMQQRDWFRKWTTL